MTRFRVTGKPPVKPQGEWLRVSHEMTWEVEEMADQETLVVKMSPDAGFDDSAFENGKLILWTQEKIEQARVMALMQGGDPTQIKDDLLGTPVGEQHPGVTFPGLGIIEINPEYLPDGLTPADMSPLVRKDHQNYPVVWGLLSHEAAHAHFSKWMDAIDERASKGKFTQEESKHLGAATILEESRIEAKQMQFRPQDQVWLQASGTSLALEEVSKQMREARLEVEKINQENPEAGARITKAAIARAAALVLARIDAGSVIPDKNTDAITTLVNEAFGLEDAVKLRAIWTEAQRTGDWDDVTMMRLGKEWYELTGDDGGAGQEQQMGLAGAGEGEGDGDGDSPLEKALKGAADASEKEASGQADRERRQNRIAQKVDKRKLEGQQQKEAKQQARGVFAGKGTNQSHPITGYRDPTAKEMTLARTTRRQLQAAYLPEKAVTKVTRQLPPGRLSMRSVQQLDAQTASGLIPDAEPFTYKDRQHVPTPPLKVGIIQDVSGSQGSAAAAAVSGAWSLAKATQMIADAEVAMVSFGDRVNAIISPREKLAKVPMLKTPYGTDYFLDALKALEGQLDLTRSGSARLVVILTDGYLNRSDLNGRDAALKRLTDFGVKFLWMVTDGDGEGEYVPKKMAGVHIFREAAGNFEIVPKIINVEAVNALKK
jgi:hypothetical protein